VLDEWGERMVMSCGVPTYATFSKLEKLAVSEDFNLPEGD
jgi:hypothetical protein